MTISNAQRASVLVHALPYIQKYYNKVVVVKYGGNAMINEKLKQSVMSDIVLMSLIGIKVVLVHGGGPEITEMLDKIGKKSEFVDGLRVTDSGYIPVISTIGCDNEGNVYNINADTAAAKIAAELHAESLISMTDISGIMRDPSDPESLISKITADEAPKLVESGVISGGMIPKVNCCIDAIHAGVKKVFIIDGRIPHSILIETLTDEGIGTMFVKGENNEHI